jgi:Ser/Thr protein kinase RdoA (MazF antagonist)
VTGEAAAAAAAWGGARGLRLVRARENAVYEAVLAGTRAALRLHRRGYQTEAAIRSELWWCVALAGAGIAVPRPLPCRDGALLHRLPSGRVASAVAWIDGEPLGEAGLPLPGPAAQQAALYRALGGLLAALHDVTDALVLPEGFERPRWDSDGLVGEAPFWGRFWDHPLLLPDERTLLQAARAHLAGVLARLGGPVGLIHADALRENVLVRDAAGPSPSLTLIDFDDCGFGFRPYDLGVAMSQCLAEPARDAIAAALVEGYAARRPLDPAVRAALPDFTLMRCCASVGWTMPRLAPDDPVHRRHIDRALRLARSVLDGRGFGPPPSPG